MSEKYDLLNELGLCHRCEKAKCAPNKKFCPACLEKIAIENARRYDPKKAHEYQERRKEIYKTKKEQGICVRCTKPATHGIYCYECSINAKRRNSKQAERRKRLRQERGLIPEHRKKSHLCLRCGQPLDDKGMMLCSKCIEENKKNSKLADKSYFRRLESERFKHEKKEMYVAAQRKVTKIYE